MTPTSRANGEGVDQPQDGTPLPIGARLGDFDIRGVIRRGGFAIVYVAADQSSQRSVAIKEYLPATLADRMADNSVVVRTLRHQKSFREGMQGFLSEARLLASLDEPALVKVLHSWEQHGTAYMAMPLYEGRTLKDALRDSPKPKEAELKTLLSPLLDALATLHGAGSFPCDVTPDNILVLSDGAPLLFDLGTARRIIASSAEDVTIVLKPGFAPIEQYARDPSMPEGPWTDIYTVAAVIYLAITGKPPTTSTTRIVSDSMRPLREVTKEYSEAFLDGVDRGLAMRPENRPQSIAEFRAALGIPAGAPATGNPAPESIPLTPASPPPAAPGAPSRVEPRSISSPPPAGAGVRAGAPDSTRIRVLGDGSKPTLSVSPAPAQVSASAGTRAAAGGGVAGAPRKLIVSLVMLGLAGIALLIWTLNRSGDAPRRAADNGSSMTPAQTSAPPSPPTSTAPAATSNPQAAASGTTGSESPATPPASDGQGSGVASAPDSNPLAANPPSAASTPPKGAGSTPPKGAGSGARPATLPQENSAPAAATSGKVQFSIKPWGEILIDGKSRGVSPPVKVLTLPPGRHRIEIRNSTFPGYASEVDIKAGGSVSIAHSFKAP